MQSGVVSRGSNKSHLPKRDHSQSVTTIKSVMPHGPCFDGQCISSKSRGSLLSSVQISSISELEKFRPSLVRVRFHDSFLGCLSSFRYHSVFLLKILSAPLIWSKTHFPQPGKTLSPFLCNCRCHRHRRSSFILMNSAISGTEWSSYPADSSTAFLLNSE